MIYLDHNATTPVDPAVLEAMLPWFTQRFGNAGAAHRLGLEAEGAVVAARIQVAELLACDPAEVVFNSGGTEGLNQVLRGCFEASPAKRHLVTTAVEHSAVLALADWIRAQGGEVTVLGVDGEGRLDLAELEAALRPDTALLSVMAANNETGVRFPLADIGRLAKARGVRFHVDATQAIGKVPLDVATLPIDFLNLSAHKFHGPKGVGALFIRRGLRLKPFMIGGHQERGRRGGTENVTGIVGLGKAASLAQAHLGEGARVQALRDHLETELLQRVPDAGVHGRGAERLPNTSFMGFRGLEGEALLLKLDERGVCVATGSACTTGQREPSHVLRAMGVPTDLAKGTVRFSLGRGTTEAEIEHVLALVPAVVAELRAAQPFAR